MAPGFTPGDYLLLRRCCRVKAGDLVVYQHPQYGAIFKRVSPQPEPGQTFSLCSDNPAGLGQQAIGLCQTTHLRGKLLWRFKRPASPA